jgi:hypothetical protein
MQFCRRSSTFVKVCQKSSIFILKFSAGKSKTFFDTCVNWSCVTRCGCRTTLSTLFTVYDNNNSVYIKGISDKKRWGKMFVMWKYQ